jgi:hypothetical protein
MVILLRIVRMHLSPPSYNIWQTGSYDAPHYVLISVLPFFLSFGSKYYSYFLFLGILISVDGKIILK